MARAGGYDVAVVGGGNLGLWAARGLARRGVRRVAVLDRDWFGFGATARSGGMIRAQGGTVTATLLGLRSRELYQRLGEEIGLDSGFARTGYYVLAESDEEAAHFRDLAAMRREHGGHGEWLDADEGRRRVPWLDWARFRGATFDPDDGYVHPPVVARNIVVAAGRCAGIEFFERCAVDAVDSAGTGWRVRHAGGELAAGQVLLAGGAAGGALGRMVGVEVPVGGARHHVVAYASVGPQMPRNFPQLFAVGSGFYVRPEEEGALLGLSRREPSSAEGQIALPFDRAYVDVRLPEVEALLPDWQASR